MSAKADWPPVDQFQNINGSADSSLLVPVELDALDRRSIGSESQAAS